MTLNHAQLSLTPPMGWNSWDCFGTTVNEDQVRSNADYMADHLLECGWTYIVVDIHWYEPNPRDYSYFKGKQMIIDQWGRFFPEENRFPSSKNGEGFKPLAEYIHNKGLKFGIHILRGIPRQAVQNNCPILHSSVKASEIANPDDQCPWNPTMYGVDMTKTGAQEYYNSIFELYAEWGVDFIKVDDLGFPYHHLEAEAIRKAIDLSGRPMIISVSPGPALVENAYHLSRNTNMWRISGDFWDNWIQLRSHFDLCAKWVPFVNKEQGTWPDADMLPLGQIRMVSSKRNKRGRCFLSHRAQYTLITLFVMFRSPLFFGGHLPGTDSFTLNLLTNKNVLYINQNTKNNRDLITTNDKSVWIAEDTNSADLFIAFFNLTSWKIQKCSIKALNLKYSGSYQVWDVWSQRVLGFFSSDHEQNIHFYLPPHGSRLVRLKLIA